LEQILLDLKHHGVVASRRGKTVSARSAYFAFCVIIFDHRNTQAARISAPLRKYFHIYGTTRMNGI
ncbi:hypothetical protein ACC696_38100, partial [Rhizobium ruizarguesonis]